MHADYMTHIGPENEVTISVPSDISRTGCLKILDGEGLYIFPPNDPIAAHLFLEALIARATELHRSILAVIDARLAAAGQAPEGQPDEHDAFTCPECYGDAPSRDTDADGIDAP